MLLIALALLSFLFQASQLLAQAPDLGTARARLETIGTELGQIETALANPAATDEELQRQRVRLQPSLDQLRTIVEAQGPRVEQAKQRLDQLGPKPEATAPPESAEIAREREARTKAFAEADETLKIARAGLLQAEQILASISDRRRALFARALFAAGPSLLGSDIWSNAAASVPSDLQASGYIFGGWLSGFDRAFTGARGVLLGLALLGAALLFLARARYLPRFKARFGRTQDAGSLHGLYVALAHLVAGAAPPALASWLIYAALNTAGLLPPRIEPVIAAAVVGLAIFSFVQALADAVFAPGQPQRRLVSVMDSTAQTVVWIATALAAIMSVSKVLEAWLQAIAAALSVSIVLRGVLVILFAMALIAGLNRIRDDQEIEEDADLGPYVPVDGASLAPLRVLGWIVGLVIILAALGGYIPLAAFLAEQTLWLGVVACLFLLAYQLIDLGVPHLLAGRGRFALKLKAGLGFRSETLEKIAVIGAGLLKIALFVVTFLLVLAPWGLESEDFLGSLRAAFFGFQVGGVTISVSSIVIGALVFALGLTATRSLQGWLEGKFLPTTSLDPGLRNSITTAAGYVGYIAAAALAFSTLGLSLERLTLVASALSVGIGFGLQSVVSNFVSGLILLWERPIRVGDQVLVGDTEGIVKRINVRSTEIATFDRSTVIVPNSNFITGVVRNRVRADRTGRALVAITVPRALDATDVREMLAEVAAAHGDVLQKPPPSVQFKKIGTMTMDFELICVVADVDIVGRVTSDLNFAIHKRLSAMEPAAEPAEMTIRGLDGVERSLGEIATAVAGEGSRRKPPKRASPAVAAARGSRRAQPAETQDEEPAPAPAPPPEPEPARDDSKE